MSKRFHSLLRVYLDRATEPGRTAAFLSGGTDSSTVAGVYAELQSKPVRTYSIGFATEGFDEMEYARLAARYFGLDARVLPQAGGHPHRHRRHHHPVRRALRQRVGSAGLFLHQNGGSRRLSGHAGRRDGGNEIFGGSARYAKQKVFKAYHRIPGPLRGGVIEPLTRLLGLNQLPLVAQAIKLHPPANIPLPERMKSYNSSTGSCLPRCSRLTSWPASTP